jgi:hypothetical protein
MELEVLGEQLPEDIYVRPDHEYDVSVSSCVSWLQFLLERERQTATTNHTNETLTLIQAIAERFNHGRAVELFRFAGLYPGTKIEKGSWMRPKGEYHPF